MRVEMTLGRVSSSSCSLGKIGVSFSKTGAFLGFFRVQPVDRLDFEQAVVFFGLLGRAHLPDNQVSGAQAKAPDLALADVDILRARQQMIAAQKADVVLYDLQDAATEDEALLFCIGAQKAHDQVVLFQACIAGNVRRARDLAQFVEIQHFHLANGQLF